MLGEDKPKRRECDGFYDTDVLSEFCDPHYSSIEVQNLVGKQRLVYVAAQSVINTVTIAIIGRDTVSFKTQVKEIVSLSSHR